MMLSDRRHELRPPGVIRPAFPFAGWVFFVLGVVAGGFSPAAAQTKQIPQFHGEVKHDTSPPLRDLIRLAPRQALIMREAEPARRIPLPSGLTALPEDPVRQRTAIAAFAPVVSQGFEGLGAGQYGFTVTGAPPDTNGAVGATQYVQWVNTSFAIFNKSNGALISGPTAGNTLWSGFGGGCETNNDGDPIVLYDKLANRWIFSQFSVTSTPFLQCIAVSTTSDATGSYTRYSFQYSDNDDYPKMGVWPDAYYETFNMFDSRGNFVGADACAYDRNAMLNGTAATQICFQQNSSVGGLLPSDLDGTTVPPAGSPNYMLSYGTNDLDLFHFHADFATPSNSTFTGPTVIPVAAFSPLCNGGTCVPQPGTTNQLDSLADRLMYRLAYRNFGTHESLVVNHSVTTSSGGGVRWYEIQNPGGTPVLAQQGTFAPDSSYRWMGSIAMDKAADIAVGYSVSNGTSVFPSIAFTGRLSTDPSGTLQAETTVVSGSGSQTTNPQGGNFTRWGDYSAMQVDPVDDCTFWYTQEYIKTNGTFNWNTRIANFKFPNCTSGTSSFPLTVALAGTGSGTVSSSPTGINCPGTCSANFNSGTVVSLTATAATGASFAGWSGACTGTGTCNVTMSAARSVTATFNTVALTFPLGVTLAGTGSGTVTSSPTGINCPGVCSVNFNSGTGVTLTATAASGSTFAGWSGACTGTGACSVTVTAAKSVTATFNATTTPFPLSVTLVGSGTVTSVPAGIACPSTCTANFNSGTAVALNASPTSGSSFAGWSGACSGTAACSVIMTAAKSVTATFITGTTTSLTVSASQVTAGTTVTFTAKVTPASGSGTPTGTVTFKNGSAVMGTGTLTGGTAIYSTSNLAIGNDVFTATYGGDTNFSTSTSSAANVAVGDFAIASSQSSLSVQPGQSVQTTLTITPEPMNNFNQTVTFSCSGLPSQATCSFSPASVSPSGSAVTSTLTIQTTAPSARFNDPFGRSGGLLYAMLVPGIMGLVRLGGMRTRTDTVRMVSLIAILVLSTLSTTACGGGNTSSTSNKLPSTPGTPAGTSTVTVMASTAGSNSLSHQVKFNLIVQ